MKTLKMKSAQKRWGIVVGIDKYINANEFLHNLQGCVIDAHKMYDTMTNKDCCGFLKDHVRLLENPDFDELEEAFADTGTKMCDGDELWFYFAGHGYSDKNRPRENGYLLLSGARYDKRGFLRSDGSMSKHQLEDIVGQHIRVGGVTVVFFLDCCCAASVGLNTCDRAVQEATELDDINVSFGSMSTRDLAFDSCEKEVEPMRFMRFCATGKYGRAREDKDGGAFTERLIEGLRGGTSDHPATFGDDIYVRAGTLGLYVCDKVQGQDPKQEFSDPMYPLSISKEKKKFHDQIEAFNTNVGKWLAGLQGCVHEKQFAERVLVREEDFKYAGVMLNVLRLVSDPNVLQLVSDSSCPVHVKNEQAAQLLKMFFELRELLKKPDGAQPIAAYAPPTVPRRKESNEYESERISLEDRRYLDELESRLEDADGCDYGISKLTSMSCTDVVAELTTIARMRLRKYCSGIIPYRTLYGSNDRAKWKNRADGGLSAVGNAIYEFILDDESLECRRKTRG